MLRAVRAYRCVDLNSARPQDVLIRLYDRLIRDIDDAEAAIVRRDILAKSSACDHAARILSELSASLDRASAPELCARLESLYLFALGRIADASLRLEPAPLHEARTIVNQLRASFCEVMTP
jgi:flagellar secretion chaperone FliS